MGSEHLTPADVQAAVEVVKKRFDKKLSAAIVLGSGLGDMADRIENQVVIPYEEFTNFPKPTVKGHEGRLVFGEFEGRNVVVMQGRFHLYEGYHPSRIVIGIRLFAALGVETLILTNAAGATTKSLSPGDIMLITDHLNMLCANPLAGPHYEAWGERFVDMTKAYDPGLRETVKKACKKASIKIKEGVYAAMAGPSYETAAEVKMLAILGAQAAGMSTVPECIVGRQMGMRVLGLSLITNMGAGLENGPISHGDVIKLAKKRYPDMEKIIRSVVAAT